MGPYFTGAKGNNLPLLKLPTLKFKLPALRLPKISLSGKFSKLRSLQFPRLAKKNRVLVVEMDEEWLKIAGVAE